jgi:hypothetical protein
VTCRDEVLVAARALETTSADRSFTIAEVVAELRRRGSRFSESTICTHVASRMCVNAPEHHAVVYGDLERIAHGRYRLLAENH